MTTPLPRLVLLALLAPLAACGSDEPAGDERDTATLTDAQSDGSTGAEQYAAYVRTRPSSCSPDPGVRRGYTSGDDDAGPRAVRADPDALGAIEPVAESFGDLDPRLDLREADLEEGQEWTGWHRIEKDLWPPAAGATRR